MFTGLIEEVGLVKKITESEIEISSKKLIETAMVGDSIAVNGLCLTITKMVYGSLFFHISKTTKENSRFNIGEIRAGEEVNLEAAIRLGGKFGGHIVQGHVDGKIKIISINKKGEDIFFEFFYPEDLRKFIAEKGSVSIDGISLTVSKVLSRSFVVTVIPHTVSMTNLKNKKAGDSVHLEVDFFARYIFNILNNGGIKWN
jgi:riboflavin synthase